MKKKSLFYLFLLAQVLVLITITISFYAIDWMGKEVRLKTAPVDPRDYFYGDYVILRYDISNLPGNLWREKTPPKSGDPVYVVLKRMGSYDQAVAIYTHKPSVPDDQTVLQGQINSQDRSTISIQYGLERYYVPENTGKEIEKQRNHLSVVIRAAPWGQAKISRLDFE
jgi:uncharacterized membrane-anchored protein